MSNSSKPLPRRNPIAQKLRSPLFRKRVVADKTKYNRKQQKRAVNQQD